MSLFDLTTRDEFMNDKAVEEEIQEKGLTAPRVTPADIDNAIDDLAAIQYHQFPGTTVTVACVPLKNGYILVGKSACASLENFDVELGRKIAVDDAKRKLWPLLGYALKEELARQPAMAE